MGSFFGENVWGGVIGSGSTSGSLPELDKPRKS